MKELSMVCLLGLCLLSACATVQEQVRYDADRLNFLPNKPIEHTFYLLGDAGLSPENSASSGLQTFQKYIANRDTSKDVVLFLGDNIYPAGMPEVGAKARKSAEYNLDSQIKSLTKFNGKSILFQAITIGIRMVYTD
ncbi:hypothetical protein MWU59_09355 [Flavobacteriaceae bacterium F08102]|nr:hypothetical protein [Flavobacteriaceae bacterium F08102]